MKTTLKAFTIVELLVVIVVIGILATITIVSYLGITNRAVIASAQSDLSNASKKLKIYQLENDIYPIDRTAAINAKLIPDSNNYSYYVDNTTTPKTFCLSYINQDNNIAYSINQDGSPIPAPYCPILYLDASNPNSYPGSGTTWYDLSGLSNNAALTNGPTFTLDNGGAFSFDGVDDYVTISPIEFKTSQSWTYRIKMLIPSGWDNNWRNIMSSTIDTDSTWLFHSGSSSLIFYQDYYNSSTWIWYSGLSVGNQIPKDALFNLTVTCEPISTYQTKFSVYINNILMSQSSFTWSSRLVSPRQIFSRIGGTGLGTRYYLGSIKSVHIYSRALSGSEISAY